MPESLEKQDLRHFACSAGFAGVFSPGSRSAERRNNVPDSDSPAQFRGLRRISGNVQFPVPAGTAEGQALRGYPSYQ